MSDSIYVDIQRELFCEHCYYFISLIRTNVFDCREVYLSAYYHKRLISR